MKRIKARVRAGGNGSYMVKVEGLGRDGDEVARYTKSDQVATEQCARASAGAFVRGYNQAVMDVTEAIKEAIVETYAGK